jgi:hypothetical protein
VFQASLTAVAGIKQAGHHSLGLWFYTAIAITQIFFQVKSFVGVVQAIADYTKLPVLTIKPKRT